MCGGTAESAPPAVSPRGLSPRVRGNPNQVARNRNCSGSIPACAGEPLLRHRRAGIQQVYPRVCGGTGVEGLVQPPLVGLSPRVRGNHGLPYRRPVWPWSIPACAGEPLGGGLVDGHSGVYPRVCGGTPQRTEHQLASQGLSPRVRGNPFGVAAGQRWPGSIPACAGEPRRGTASILLRRVYPRVCGGTILCPATGAEIWGLSPRVRGNLGGTPVAACSLRSIPACAGEPLAGGLAAAIARVYPRVCGGTSFCVRPLDGGNGLSPRVRGNRAGLSCGVPAPGSIPACAGEPYILMPAPAEGRVYPRVCGGTCPLDKQGGVPGGLSPRVRGNPDAAGRADCPAGSIPACAGEPAASYHWAFRFSVYPRVCGGTCRRRHRCSRRRGLSPRVRGNRLVQAG